MLIEPLDKTGVALRRLQNPQFFFGFRFVLIYEEEHYVRPCARTRAKEKKSDKIGHSKRVYLRESRKVPIRSTCG
jgi:hypothetical protein